MASHLSILAQQLKNAVLERTNRGIWNLAVEVHPERIILRGNTDTFYAKQLAQEGVLQVLPEVKLENAIQVAGSPTFLMAAS